MSKRTTQFTPTQPSCTSEAAGIISLDLNDVNALIGWLTYIEENSGEELDENDQDLLNRLKKVALK